MYLQKNPNSMIKAVEYNPRIDLKPVILITKSETVHRGIWLR